jgi:hypothetical protein
MGFVGLHLVIVVELFACTSVSYHLRALIRDPVPRCTVVLVYHTEDWWGEYVSELKASVVASCKTPRSSQQTCMHSC